jgi:hypothetical protein
LANEKKTRCLVYFGNAPRKFVGAIFVVPAQTWEDVKVQICEKLDCDFEYERMSVKDMNYNGRELVIRIKDSQKPHQVNDHWEACGGSLAVILS